MRTLRRLVLLAVAVGGLLAATAPAPAQAMCTPGRVSVKPLVVELPRCPQPDGGPS